MKLSQKVQHHVFSETHYTHQNTEKRDEKLQRTWTKVVKKAQDCVLWRCIVSVPHSATNWRPGTRNKIDQKQVLTFMQVNVQRSFPFHGLEPAASLRSVLWTVNLIFFITRLSEQHHNYAVWEMEAPRCEQLGRGYFTALPRAEPTISWLQVRCPTTAPHHHSCDCHRLKYREIIPIKLNKYVKNNNNNNNNDKSGNNNDKCRNNRR